MPMTNLIVACILLMFVSTTIQISKSRHLRLREISNRSEQQTSSKHVLIGKSTFAMVNSDQLEPEAPTQLVNAAQPPPLPPAGHLDSYRPTTPGHSPGAGHSFQLQVSSEQMVKHASTNSDEKYHHSRAENTYKTMNSDEMVPEAPSPSVSATLPPPPPPTRHMDNFKSTTPGHSPGAGHSTQN